MVILDHIRKVKQLVDFFNRKKKLFFKISDYIDENNIIFLEATNRNDILLEMIENVCRTNKIKNKIEFYKKIIEREKTISTTIGMGVAIPHAKLDQFDDFFIAIGIIKKRNIVWHSIDNLPVRIIFMIGGPEKKTNEYLQLLSELTLIIKNPEIRRKMLRSFNKHEILELFQNY